MCVSHISSHFLNSVGGSKLGFSLSIFLLHGSPYATIVHQCMQKKMNLQDI
jgi:hypothetical protein